MKRFLVYFWATECGQFAKIGHCQSSLFVRGSNISNGCPIPLCKYPSGVIVCEDKDDMLQVERATQRQFKVYRTNGEWFKLVDEISEHIQEFTDAELGKRFVEEDEESHRRIYRERKRERMKDPEYRERERERSRERYQKDPEYREHLREHDRNRRKDPKYREYQREYQRERNWERMKDPKYREYQREYRARKKREKQPINGQQLKLFDEN